MIKKKKQTIEVMVSDDALTVAIILPLEDAAALYQIVNHSHWNERSQEQLGKDVFGKMEQTSDLLHSQLEDVPAIMLAKNRLFTRR